MLGFTILHESVEDELRGRVFSALYVLVRFCLLLAIGVGGFLSEALDWVFETTIDSEVVPTTIPNCSTAGSGVAVGVGVSGTGVSVGGTGVSVGGTGVSVGGAGVSVGGIGVSVGGTGVFVGTSGVLVGIFVGGAGVVVSVGGTNSVGVPDAVGVGG